MTVFIEARTDPFLANRRAAAQSHRADFMIEADIRRPTRGFQVKPDSFAVMRIALPDGSFLPVIDAAGEHIVEAEGRAYTTYYSNFFIRTVNDQRSEKQQITDTFGDWFIFFFGSTPNILQVNGLLLNTADFQWRNEFWENYERYLKGTRLAEMGARVYLIYDDRLIEGYILGATAMDDTEKPHVITFNFQMIVTGHTSISLVGDPNFPAADSMYARTGSYDVGREWKANKRSFDAQAFQETKRQPENIGLGRMLNDYLREKMFDSTDPANIGLLSRSQAATAGIDEFSFKPNPFGMLRDNIDEFVARGLTAVVPRDNPFGPSLAHVDPQANPFAPEMAPNPFAPEMASNPFHDQANTVDNTVANNVVPDQAGNTFNSTDREYMDTMGRQGHAANEVSPSGVGAGSARNVPFGMVGSGGDLQL